MSENKKKPVKNKYILIDLAGDVEEFTSLGEAQAHLQGVIQREDLDGVEIKANFRLYEVAREVTICTHVKYTIDVSLS